MYIGKFILKNSLVHKASFLIYNNPRFKNQRENENIQDLYNMCRECRINIKKLLYNLE